jgi:NADPH:quinone reductase-like Zn-dependent oxidoreductase
VETAARLGGTIYARPSAQSVWLLPNASYVDGASLGLPATTAVQAVRFAKIGLCSKVLITGAVAKIGAHDAGSPARG